MATNHGKRKRYTGAGTSNDQHHHINTKAKTEDDFGNQTLPVAQLPDDFDGVPADGSVYLAMVRQEAVKYPSIFLAPSNPYAFESTSTPPVQPANRADDLGMPSQAWREIFLARFLAMREALSLTSADPLPASRVGRFPRAKTTEGASKAWYRLLFRTERPSFDEDDLDEQHSGVPADESHSSQQAVREEEEEDEDQLYNDQISVGVATRCSLAPLEPTPVLLAHFNTSQILAVLTAMPYWIALQSSSRNKPGDSNLPSTLSRQAIDPLLSRWSFSLLAKLDRRLTSDEISILRVLARACIAAIFIKRLEKIREGQTASLTNEREKSESGAWIVVCIIAGVWGQTDLWMDAEEDLGRLPATNTEPESHQAP